MCDDSSFFHGSAGKQTRTRRLAPPSSDGRNSPAPSRCWHRCTRVIGRQYPIHLGSISELVHRIGIRFLQQEQINSRLPRESTEVLSDCSASIVHVPCRNPHTATIRDVHVLNNAIVPAYDSEAPITGSDVPRQRQVPGGRRPAGAAGCRAQGAPSGSIDRTFMLTNIAHVATGPASTLWQRHVCPLTRDVPSLRSYLVDVMIPPLT